MLVLERVTKRFGGLVAVQEVSLWVPAGAVYAVIGPNGAGKSTLFNLITGLLTPDEGRILLEERPVHRLAAPAVARHGVARTFQNLRLFASMTALENVMIGHRSGRGRSAKEEAEALLASVGLWAERNTLAPALPYGKQRLLEIARGLATRPRLLLLDEPSAGMIPTEVTELMRFVKKILESGVTVVLIEHNMRLVMDISDRIAVLNFGRVIAEGLPSEIRHNPQVIEAYLGTEVAHAGG